MSVQLTLDIPAPTKPTEAIVPACLHCGAEGEKITVGDPPVVHDLWAATAFALVTLAQHRDLCPAEATP